MKSAILVASLMAAALAHASKPVGPDVIVVVRGEIAAPIAVDQSARAEVAWIYAHAGVRLAWREEMPPASEGQVVIELRYAMAAASGVSSGALAYALPFEKNRATIAVLYDRVRHAAGRMSLEPGILTCVLAHEIGHILQRSDAHSPAGIMKAHWTSQDYDAIAKHALRFSAVDLELIRAGLASLKDQ